MFKSARIKLTGWYLLIIMLISLFFSMIIYAATSSELERGFRRVEMRFRAGELDIPPPVLRQLPGHLENISPRLIEDLGAAKERLALNLLMLNGMILLFSSVAGYFLAGKTLKPIEMAMEDQKRFIADASHELRTPLTALKTSIEVAIRGKRMKVGEARKVLESNLRDVDGLQSLTDRLLALTQYQQGNSNFVFRPVAIDDLIRNTCRKIDSLAKQKNIKLIVKALPQVIEANQSSLEGMMIIFLDNAVKYTPDGGKIMVTTVSDKKNVVIKIKDTGIGISKEEIPHIFDRFYRADQSRSKDKVPGFGLGLSLVKRIVEIHKGSLGVESSLGKGTTFTVKLPL